MHPLLAVHAHPSSCYIKLGNDWISFCEQNCQLFNHVDHTCGTSCVLSHKLHQDTLSESTWDIIIVYYSIALDSQKSLSVRPHWVYWSFPVLGQLECELLFLWFICKFSERWSRESIIWSLNGGKSPFLSTRLGRNCMKQYHLTSAR